MQTKTIEYKRIVYVASDGMEFLSLEQCQEYERRLTKKQYKGIPEKLPHFEQYANYEDDLDAKIHWYYVSSREEYTAVLCKLYNDGSDVWDALTPSEYPSWMAFFVDQDGWGCVIGTARDFFNELQWEYIDAAVDGMKEHPETIAEPDPKMCLCEAVYDISLQAQHLLEEGCIQSEDSRELFESVYEWAKEFETKVHEDYMAEIEDFGYEKLVEQYGQK